MRTEAGTGGRRVALFLAVALIVSLPAVTPRINASDEIQFFSWLHSWTFDGDVDFDNEYRYFHDAGPGQDPGFVATFLEHTNEAGRRRNYAPIGSAVLWLPFYGVGHLVALATDAPADGFSRPYIAAVAYGSAFYGWLALVLSALIARDVVGRWLTGPVALVWLGTPLLFYMYVAPGFAHATSAFAVALFLWTWLRVRQTWSTAGVVMLGVTAALLPMVREQDAFVVAAPAIDFVRWSWRRLRTATSAPARRADARRAVALACLGVSVALVCYVPQLLAYLALNGHPTPTTEVARKMTWSSPHFLAVLFSPQHGFFFWTPLAFVALTGLAWLTVARDREAGANGTSASGPRPDRRWIALLLALVAVLQVYVSGSVESWTVAGAFGQRRFVALTPVLVVGLAALWPRDPRRPMAVAAGVLGGVLVWWNIGLMAQFGLHLMDRQRLSPAANAWTTFVELPGMAPAIVARYLTDRDSFYGLPRE